MAALDDGPGENGPGENGDERGDHQRHRLGAFGRRLAGGDPRDLGTEPDPRFSYANERTFLAWNRTGLALVGVGLAVANLLPRFDLSGGRRMIALPLIGLGGVVSLLSLREWADNERAMRRHVPLPGSRLPVVLAASISVVAVIAIVVSAFGAAK